MSNYPDISTVPNSSNNYNHTPVGAYPNLNTEHDPNAPITTTAPNEVKENHYEGWLQKKGAKGLIQTWKKRFFIANIDSIKYYADEKQVDYRGNILWEHVTNIQFSTSAVWSDNRYFEIQTNRGRVYFLFADDQYFSLNWINALKKIHAAYIVRRDHIRQAVEKQAQAEQAKQEQLNQQKQYEEQLIQQQQQFQNSNSPYREFTNYIHQGFSHFDSIGTPIASPPPIDSSLHIPPRPPGPLRTLDHETVKSIVPSEGKDLEIYYESTTYFANILMAKPQNEYHILAAYLILATLDWDNKKTQPLPYPCTPPYESDIVYPYFTYCLHLIRTIDTFTKKKRQNYLLILENEDRETFLNRNMLLLSYALNYTVMGNKLAVIEDAILVLIDRFLENYESLPSIKYGAFLWKEIEQADKNNSFTPSDKAMLQSFTHSYLLYQKLHLENKNNNKFKLDPIITQKYENVSHNFSTILHQLPILTPFSGHIQRTIVKIFYLWHRDLPLCESTSTFEVSVYRNYKVFIRILSKLDSIQFTQLFNSVKEVQETLYRIIERNIGVFDMSKVDISHLQSIMSNK
ncbi:hypothetical protein PPL_02632 [Heterostelium album PN500]|uniref:PH domain-containing protein n=1 Tax=Heterostelium pallidum (strain ATCC 26659 / Pp 5 / PN500) TaxID=670386 RepID=D3B2L8_HETP5|nr:hypothetical protein PPL_02632 [Heterostelium album PN500]EFA83566.1 hypothetical protein PPL_02632 [Heterostelium album PN500]|eukprot:XP_020435683.1 hypothetical protein PPL_02632 [Heterostelium album PN500]